MFGVGILKLQCPEYKVHKLPTFKLVQDSLPLLKVEGDHVGATPDHFPKSTTHTIDLVVQVLDQQLFEGMTPTRPQSPVRCRLLLSSEHLVMNLSIPHRLAIGFENGTPLKPSKALNLVLFFHLDSKLLNLLWIMGVNCRCDSDDTTL